MKLRTTNRFRNAYSKCNAINMNFVFAAKLNEWNSNNSTKVAARNELGIRTHSHSHTHTQLTLTERVSMAMAKWNANVVSCALFCFQLHSYVVVRSSCCSLRLVFSFRFQFQFWVVFVLNTHTFNGILLLLLFMLLSTSSVFVGSVVLCLTAVSLCLPMYTESVKIDFFDYCASYSASIKYRFI